MKRQKLFILSTCILSFCLSGCGNSSDVPSSNNVSTISSQNSDISSVEEKDNIPETGKADRSDLKYVEELDAYKKSDWKGHWIWTTNCYEDSYVAFRKKFTLDNDIENITAYISAESKYCLWVNEELVTIDGSLKRGPTPYDSYYDEVNISKLKKGDNIISLLVAFNGRSGDSSINPTLEDEEGDMISQAGLLFEMQVGNTLIKSDTSFKAHRVASYRNRISGGKDYISYPQSSMLAERNVFYDARVDEGDYRKLDYDDSSWENAKSIAKAGNLPFGDLYLAITEPIKFYDVADFENAGDYTGKTLENDTVLELNLPTDVQFSWIIDIDAEAGQRLTFYTDSYVYNDGVQSFKDTYIAKSGNQYYENYPWRSGYKLYIEAPSGVKFNKIAYRLSEYNGELLGAIESSDSSIDTLWKKAQNTVRVCMRDTFMDCPDRERGPYMGDASNQIDAALYCYGEGGLEMIKKTILSCVGWVKNDNAIPSRAPSVKPQEIPNQSLAFLSSAYHYYEHSGDKVTMKSYIKAVIEYLKLFEMQNGLPKYRAGSWTWNDWGEAVDANLLQVGFYYYALRLTKQLVAELEMDVDISFIEERMAAMKANYHNAYYTENGFKSSSSKYIDDRANALLALSGLAEPSDYDVIINVLTNTRQASPFCEKYVLEALCYLNRVDLAKERMLSRYDDMIKDSRDTLYEKFDLTDGTFNHAWTSGPIYIINRYIVGLKPTKAGYEEYSLTLNDLLDSYKCSNYTVKGNIDLEMNYEDGVRTLSIKNIASKGNIIIPNSLGNDISVNGGTYQSQVNSNQIVVTINEAKTYTIIIK